MKYFLLLPLLWITPLSAQVLSDAEVTRFAVVIAEIGQNLPDQQLFGQKVVTELNIQPEDVNRINSNIGNLSDNDKAIYAEMSKLYDKELEKVARRICDKHQLNYHFYLQMYTLYEGDERFKELVNNKISNFRLDR